MSLRGRAARGGAIVLISQAIRIAVQLGATVILARLIAPEYFGLLAMVVSIVGVAEILRDFGLSQSALRRTDLTQQQQSNLFWLNTLFGLVFGIALWGLAVPIANFYGQPQLVTIVHWIAPTCLIGGLTTQFRVRINTELRFTALAVVDVISPTVAFAVAVCLAAMGHPISALIAMQALGPVVMLVLSVGMARWWPGLPHRTPGMRELVTFGVSFAFTQLLSYFTRNVDSIAIGKVWGAVPLGYYDRAYQLAAAPLNQVNAPLSRVAIPVLARTVHDRNRYVRSLRDAQLIQTYVVSTGLLVAAGIGTPLIEVVLGTKWTAAGVIFSVLALGSVFRSFQQIAYWMFMTLGLAGSQLRLYLFGQPAIVACLLVGVHWGPIGAAWGSTIGWALFWIASLLWVGKASGIDTRALLVDPLRVIGVVGVPPALMGIAVSAWVPCSPVGQVLLGVTLSSVWILLITATVEWVRRDLRTLRTFVRLAFSRGG